MNKFFLFFIILFTTFVFAQNKDADSYKDASAKKDPVQKIDALQKFIFEFQKSNYLPRAYYDISTTYLQLDKTDSAITYADKFVNAYPPDARFNPYNTIAYIFAEKKVALDTSLAYITRAVESARSKKVRNLSQFLDTEAFVKFQMGKFDEALAVQTEAINGHENDPAYLHGLAKYQEAAGKRKDALYTGAKVIFFGDPENLLPLFNEWINKEKATDEERVQLKKEVGEKTFLELLQMVQEPKEKQALNLAAAEFYAKLGVNLDVAKQLATFAVKNLTKDSPLEERVKAHKSLGLIYAAEKKYDEALKELNLVKEFADPWDADFWLTLGRIYETKNQNENAFASYISGLYAYPPPQVNLAALALLKKMNIKEEELQKRIEEKQKYAESFEPGVNKVKNNGNILLAELFTGAECNPCQGADVAFDKLSEFYPRNNVTILEYHLHIPGPDPLTNPDAHDRYMFYGASFGTPTVILNGKEVITGGGPRFMALNRFNIYKNSLEKYFDKKPVVNLTSKAVLDKSIINVNVNLKGKTDSSSVLYIALVEKSVKYSGSNGIDQHLFVVRDLLNESNPGAIVKKSFNLDTLQAEIKSYLDNPGKHPSWRPQFGQANWRARPEVIESNNLAVIAWVQNITTKEVLNSYYTDVK